MSRPETHFDLEDATSYTLLARFNVTDFMTDPRITKAYAEFAEAATNDGGITRQDNGGGAVDVFRGATVAELDAKLAQAQREWDAHQRHYETVMAGGEVKYPFMVEAARRHAEAEGLAPLPAVGAKAVDQ